MENNSNSNRNILTLITGATIAQAMPIGISPILTRYYTPEDFGVFTIFFAITIIFATIINGRYELAIMLPKKDEDAINIFALGLVICTSLSSLLFIIIVTFSDYLISILGYEDSKIWLYFTPISIFFIGIFNLLNYFNNRMKYYKDISKSIIMKSIVLAIFQLILGFFKVGYTGLISAEILSRMSANLRLINNILKHKELLKSIKKLKILALGKKYIHFPKISVFASLANVLSRHLTNIIISSIYNVATLGFYVLVQKVLDLPLSLIGSSIAQVFFQEATVERQQVGCAIKTFDSTLKKLLIFGVPFFGILYFFVEDLFSFVFGEDWAIAGVYAKAIMPLFFTRFIVSTFTLIPIVFNKLKTDLYFQVILLLIHFGIFFLGIVFNIEFIDILYLLSYIVSSYYILYFILCRKYAINA